MPELTTFWKQYPLTTKRCEAMVTPSKTGRRCGYDAEPGSDPPRCFRHKYLKEGRTGLYMSRFYLRTLRPTLAKKLEEALDTLEPMDALDLSEELALMRVTATDAVAQYAEALAIPDSPKATEARLVAGAVLNSKLQDVSRMVESMAKVQDMKTQLQGAFAAVMSQVITVIAHAAWETFGDDHRVREFNRIIETKLITQARIEGTELTPDQDVSEMDQSVPRDPDMV